MQNRPSLFFICITALGCFFGVAVYSDAEPAVHAEPDSIVLETDHLVYTIGTDGLNRSVRDRLTDRELLNTDEPRPFMAIFRDNETIGSTAVELTRGFLYVTFGDSGVWAKIHVRAFPNYLTLELTALNDRTIESIFLLHLHMNLTKYIGSSLTNCRDDDYAVGLIPLNRHTNVEGRRKVPAELFAKADREVRLDKAKFAMYGCPASQQLDLVEQIELENGLPHPTLDGVWARRSPLLMLSSLYTELTEDTVDEAIDFAKAGGFGTIVLYKHVWCKTQGSYTIKKENFPNGEAGLKAVSDKIHAAGLRFGLHNLELVIHKHDPLVWPVPAKGFQMYPGRPRILAADIGPNDTFIPTTTSPHGLMKATDKSMFHGRNLRIGDEIIEYRSLQTTEPFGFKDCARGALRTRKAAHKANAAIDNFAEFFWSYFLPDMESDLFDTVMRNEAGVLDKYNVDYYYPDGSGENMSRNPKLPRWYARGRSNLTRFDYTKREVMFAHGVVSTHAWHMMVQGNHTDCVANGGMQHFDTISLPDIPILKANRQSFDFGWYGAFIHSINHPASRPREIEYVWAKALAYGAPISFNVPMSTLRNNGRMPKILARIKNWEALKLANYFPASVRDQMKEPGREFALVRKEMSTANRTATEYGFEQKPKWQIKPVSYAPDQFVDDKQTNWSFDNLDPDQPLRVHLMPSSSLTAYGDEQNVVLMKPGPLNLQTEGPGPNWRERQSKGSELQLRSSDEQAPDGGKSFQVNAANNSDTPMGWACAEVILDGMHDLSGHRALGTWVHGDGSGTVLHFTVEAGRRVVRDFYVRLDFEGWKFITMAEPAGGEVYDFKFPFSGYWALGNMAYDAIDRIYVFVTNMPAGAKTAVHFGQIEALKETPQAIHNPGLTVNGAAITFPGVMQPGWYLEYNGTGPVRVFDENGNTQVEVEPQGKAPIIRNGDNKLSFSCEAGAGKGQSAKVTLITHGTALK